MTGNKYCSLSASDPSQDSDCYIPETHSPAAFWDNLSQLWLTKGALKEQRQRIRLFTSAIPRSQSPQAHRSPTQHSLAERKRKRRVIQPALDFLRHCVPRTLQDLKVFARQDGPDLSDLKGVRTHNEIGISERGKLMMLFSFRDLIIFPITPWDRVKPALEGENSVQDLLQIEVHLRRITRQHRPADLLVVILNKSSLRGA